MSKQQAWNRPSFDNGSNSPLSSEGFKKNVGRVLHIKFIVIFDSVTTSAQRGKKCVYFHFRYLCFRRS